MLKDKSTMQPCNKYFTTYIIHANTCIKAEFKYLLDMNPSQLIIKTNLIKHNSAIFTLIYRNVFNDKRHNAFDKASIHTYVSNV